MCGGEGRVVKKRYSSWIYFAVVSRLRKKTVMNLGGTSKRRGNGLSVRLLRMLLHVHKT